MTELINDYWQALQSSELFKGGMAVAAISYIGYNIKPALNWIYSRLIRLIRYEITIQSDTEADKDLVRAVGIWLLENRSKNVRSLQGRNVPDITKTEKNSSPFHNVPLFRKIEWRLWSDSFIIWHSGIPLFIGKEDEKLENASHLENSIRESYTITTFFGKYGKRVIQKIINQSLKEQSNSEIEKNPKIYFLDGDYPMELSRIPNKTFDNIFHKEVDKIKDDLDYFLKSKEKYEKLGIKMKRNYCFEGPPGTGKTSLTYAIANYIGQRLYIFNPASVANETSLISALSEVAEGSVIVWEDIDAIMKSRLGDEGPDKSKISFSGLLNILDGPYGNRSVINILTTNRVELFDEALVRKGRIDLMVHLGYPTKRDISNFIGYNFGELEKNLYIKENNLNEQEKVPMSAIQEMALTSENYNEFIENLNGEKEKTEG